MSGDFVRCEMSMEPLGVRPPWLVARRWGGRGADEVPPLAVALSPSPELTESWVNAVAINVVR
jgi:hypothetical protein